MRLSILVSTDDVVRIGHIPKHKVVCCFAIEYDGKQRKEIVRQFENIMIKSKQKLIDFMDSAEYAENNPTLKQGGCNGR